MGSTKTKSIDDVGFIRALIAHMVASGADAQRVYVIGFSLGGQLRQRIGRPGFARGATNRLSQNRTLRSQHQRNRFQL
jgi:poly(3-hydroxybutyrate) depolymerase